MRDTKVLMLLSLALNKAGEKLATLYGDNNGNIWCQLGDNIYRCEGGINKSWEETKWEKVTFEEIRRIDDRP